jgi:hypothetical protein
MEDIPPWGRTILFQEILLDRLLKCCEKEDEYFGRSISRRWQRLNSLFVEYSAGHGSEVV